MKMQNYEKPIVILNSDLSEGVYTASGLTGGLTYTLQDISGDPTVATNKKYSISFTNTGNERIEYISVSVRTYGTIIRVSSDKTTCIVNTDGSVTISYDVGINGGETIDGGEIIVEGSGVGGTRDYGFR